MIKSLNNLRGIQFPSCFEEWKQRRIASNGNYLDSMLVRRFFTVTWLSWEEQSCYSIYVDCEGKNVTLSLDRSRGRTQAKRIDRYRESCRSVQPPRVQATGKRERCVPVFTASAKPTSYQVERGRAKFTIE